MVSRPSRQIHCGLISPRQKMKGLSMTATQIVSLMIPSGTWVGFASTMKIYFRCADQRTAAKTALILCGFACTAAQIAVIAIAKPAGAAWFWLGVGGFALANLVFWWALSAHGKSHPAF